MPVLPTLLHYLARFDAPIFTYENILSKAGFTEGSQSDGTGKDENWIKTFIEEQNPEKRDEQSAQSGYR